MLALALAALITLSDVTAYLNEHQTVIQEPAGVTIWYTYGGYNGISSYGEGFYRITLREGLPLPVTAALMAHEWAHIAYGMSDEVTAYTVQAEVWGQLRKMREVRILERDGAASSLYILWQQSLYDPDAIKHFVEVNY